MTTQEAQQLFNEEIERLLAANFPIHDFDRKLYFHARSTSFGTCKYSSERPGMSRIFLSIFFVEGGTEAAIRNTLVHELLHTIDRTAGHRGAWLKWANKANELFGLDIKRVCGGKTDQDINSIESVRQEKRKSRLASATKYILSCTACGHEWVYTRKTNTVKEYARCKCPYCHTRTIDLKIVNTK